MNKILVAFLAIGTSVLFGPPKPSKPLIEELKQKEEDIEECVVCLDTVNDGTFPQIANCIHRNTCHNCALGLRRCSFCSKELLPEYLAIKNILSNPSAHIRNPHQLFLFAASNGYISAIQYLLPRIKHNTKESALITAAKRGQLNVIEFLLRKHANLLFQNKQGISPLKAAAENGHINVTKFFWEKQTEIAQKEHLIQACKGQNPLYLQTLLKVCSSNMFNNLQSELVFATSDDGHIENMRTLLEAKADPDSRNEIGNTELVTAAMTGNKPLLDLLLEFKADIKGTNLQGDTALHWAAQEGQNEIVSFLLASGLEPHTLNKHQNAPIDMAIEHNRPEILRKLLTTEPYKSNKLKQIELLDKSISSSNIDAVNIIRKHTSAGSSYKLLTSAINQLLALGESTFETELKLLIDTIGINERDSTGGTLLIAAIQQGQILTIKYLLKHEADINKRHKRTKTTPLMEASRIGDKSIVTLLLGQDPDLNKANKTNKSTALMLAAGAGHNEIVELLLESGANKDLKNKKGNTALNLAKNSNHQQVVQLLISKKAAPLVDQDEEKKLTNSLSQDFEQMNMKPPVIPIINATKNGWIAVVEDLLTKYPKSVNTIDSEGKTALIHATIGKNLVLIELLLQHGADIDKVDHGGHAALFYAKELQLRDLLHNAMDRKYSTAIKKSKARSEEKQAEFVFIAMVKAENIHVVKNLLKNSKCLDINSCDDDGKTALIHAAENQSIKMIQLLLRHGADVDAVDNAGHKALFYIADSSTDTHKKMRKLLKS